MCIYSEQPSRDGPDRLTKILGKWHTYGNTDRYTRQSGAINIGRNIEDTLEHTDLVGEDVLVI